MGTPTQPIVPVYQGGGHRNTKGWGHRNAQGGGTQKGTKPLVTMSFYMTFFHFEGIPNRLEEVDAH